MNKRFFFAVGVLLGGAFGLSCVSPFYGTARIEPGWHMDAGIAGLIYLNGEGGADPYYKGIRGDLEVRYGVCKYLQGNARVGLGWGFDGKNYRNEPVPKHNFLHDVSLGSQFALPISNKKGGQITPAIRIDGGYANGEFYAYPVLLIGMGNPESFTLGTRFYYFMPCQLFFGIHIKRFDIFAGVDVWTRLNPDYYAVPPIATIGVGYNLK